MAHWSNTLDEDEECEIIEEMMQENDIEVYHDDEKKLKYFTVKGEGLFECEQCNSRWTSHRTTIKINLFLQLVSKKYQQRCKKCDDWVTPLFTSDRFEDIIDQVLDKFEERLEETEQLVDSNEEYSVSSQAPHMRENCERCLELGVPCWI